MNKDTKEFVVRSVLTAAFKPQFDELVARSNENALRQNMARHPVWYKAREDKELKPYLHYASTCSLMYRDKADERTRYAHVPHYGKQYAEAPCGRNEVAAVVAGSVCPGNMTDTSYEMSIGETDAYYELWEKYAAAYTALTSLLASYKTKAKFLADFPEYTDHFPIEATKPAPMPAVIPEKVRAELSALGIPKE